jgi:four helix bundle protein
MQRFADLEVWRRSYRLTLDIYRQSAGLPKEERFGLVPQLRRAAVSVAANIAEGSKRPHPHDYAHFLNIARGSLAEVDCVLRLCRDLRLMPVKAANPLISETDEISRMLHALRTAVLRGKG